MTTYTVARMTTENAEAFSAFVNEKIAEGFSICGGVSVTQEASYPFRTTYYQALSMEVAEKKSTRKKTEADA